MRNNFTQLPKLKELSSILEKESNRDVPVNKKDIHYPDFSSVIKLFDSLGILSDIFTEKFVTKDLTDDLIKDAKKIISSVVDKILNINIDVSLLNNIFDYLSEEDTFEKSDFIFVFGSALKLRMDKAIELYNQGFSELIVVSGSKAIYDKKEIIISEELKKYAIFKGIPEKDIIIETKSISIPDNVKSSLNLLDEKNIFYKKIILINSPYAQRRGWVHFNKFTHNVDFIRINADSLKFGRDDWYKSEQGIKLILNEFIKMKVAEVLNTA